MGKPPETLERRKEAFWNRVQRTETGCWEWQGAVTHQGYGRFMVNHRRISTHRFAYLVSHGTIPEGLSVLHHCDNPPCCRPEHLYTGTQADNIRDRELRGRGNRPKGSDRGHAKLTEEDIPKIRALLREREPMRSIAAQFGVHRVTIWKIAHGERWSHVP